MWERKRLTAKTERGRGKGSQRPRSSVAALGNLIFLGSHLQELRMQTRRERMAVMILMTMMTMMMMVLRLGQVRDCT